MPQGDASVTTSRFDVTSSAQNSLTSRWPCSSLSRPAIHTKLLAMRLVCTSFPATLDLGFAVFGLGWPSSVASHDSAAHRGDIGKASTGALNPPQKLTIRRRTSMPWPQSPASSGTPHRSSPTKKPCPPVWRRSPCSRCCRFRSPLRSIWYGFLPPIWVIWKDIPHDGCPQVYILVITCSGLYPPCVDLALRFRNDGRHRSAHKGSKPPPNGRAGPRAEHKHLVDYLARFAVFHWCQCYCVSTVLTSWNIVKCILDISCCKNWTLAFSHQLQAAVHQVEEPG